MDFPPVKYVISTKRINLLNFILKENMTSTLKQVYKENERKCD